MPIPIGSCEPGAAGVVAHGASVGADPIDHRLHALLVTGLLGTAARHGEVGTDVRGADLGSAEVDRENRPTGELIHRRFIVAAEHRIGRSAAAIGLPTTRDRAADALGIQPRRAGPARLIGTASRGVSRRS